MTVFVTGTATGTPRECDEIAPAWYPVRALPLEAMWDDAGHWMPDVLEGHYVDAEFTFADDCLTVATARVRAEPVAG